jgi:hypothetical protein
LCKNGPVAAAASAIHTNDLMAFALSDERETARGAVDRRQIIRASYVPTAGKGKPRA